MGRPSDWSLLGGADPCPGSVTETQALSGAWGKAAGGLNDAYRVLTAVTIDGTGQAVTAAEQLIGASAALLSTYQDACENCANALTSWAGALSSFQDEADRLHAQAVQAHDDQAAGQQMITAGRDERIREANARGLLDGITQAAVETLLPALVGAFSDTRGHAMIADATERLGHLLSQAEELRTRYRAEGDQVAAGLVIAPPSEAFHQAGLSADTPVGDGALAVLLAPGIDPKLASLNNLYNKAHQGDISAQSDYLRALAALSPAQLALYSAWQQNQARNPLATKNDVTASKAWWAGLNKNTQTLLIAAVPGIIGNLNGVPYTTRDKANRALLDTLKQDPSTSADTQKAIQKIQDAAIPVLDFSGKPTGDRFVISFDLNGGKPLGAVAIGNLDTAGNVTWNIPGMGTTLADGIESWTKSAQDLYEMQGDVVGDGQHTLDRSVVSWVGYDTPSRPPNGADFFNADKDMAGLEVLQPYKAKVGATLLATALDGFADTRDLGHGVGVPQMNVVAHSYGTTTASYALLQTSHRVDTVTFFGSAGIDQRAVPNAAAMHVNVGADGKAAVYVTQAFNDRVAPYLGVGGTKVVGGVFSQPEWIRESPSGEWFGAHQFSSDGGYDPTTGQAYKTVTGHDARGPEGANAYSLTSATTGHGYLDKETESGNNIALASIGHGDRIKPLVPLKEEWAPVLAEPNNDGGLNWNVDPWRSSPDETDQNPSTLGKPRS